MNRINTNKNKIKNMNLIYFLKSSLQFGHKVPDAVRLEV